VLLSTDLEPDDVVAIKLLAPKLVGVPMLVVVGEGGPDKCQFATQMLAAYGIGESVQVVQGKKSSETYPTDLLEIFAPEAAASAMRPQIVSGEAAALTASFLASCRAPFALLLKPPHELNGVDAAVLGKTTAAVYGSFNLTQFRLALPGELSDEERFAKQETLMHAMRRAMWIERSLSVGRDSVLEPSRAPALWQWLQTDATLLAIIRAWNAQTLRGFAPKVERGMQEVSAMLEGGSGDAFSRVGQALEGLDKKVQVMRSITKCEGRQVCHADTLVVALLLDTADALTPYSRRCRASHDAHGKPKPLFDGEGESSVAVLHAPAEAGRADIEAKSVLVLEQAIGGGVPIS